MPPLRKLRGGLLSDLVYKTSYETDQPVEYNEEDLREEADEMDVYMLRIRSRLQSI